MNKNQYTSWGVSFGSLALVAGMVSYLGITNGVEPNKSNLSNQVPATSQQPSFFSDGSNSSTSDSSTSFDNGSQSLDGSNNSFSNDGTYSRRSRRFDTTTGGS